MATAKVRKGKNLPHGTLAGASPELRDAYYYYNIESKLPPLPELSPDHDSYEQDFQTRHDTELLSKIIFPILRGKSRQVIYMRYWQDMSLEEVAVRLDVTRERIRQIEIKALRNLRMLIFQADICRQPRHLIPIWQVREYDQRKRRVPDLRLGEFWYYLEA